MPSGKLGRNGYIEYSTFEEVVRVPFGGMSLPVPCGYDSILRGIYGDYMQLPPEEARIPHHSYKNFWKQTDGERDGRNHAVILAADKSSQFFPPLYDKPKGLFEYRSEILIERQVRQLREASVGDIAVVVGYEKERFFYLGTVNSFAQIQLAAGTATP